MTIMERANHMNANADRIEMPANDPGQATTFAGSNNVHIFTFKGNVTVLLDA